MKMLQKKIVCEMTAFCTGVDELIVSKTHLEMVIWGKSIWMQNTIVQKN